MSPLRVHRSVWSNHWSFKSFIPGDFVTVIPSLIHSSWQELTINRSFSCELQSAPKWPTFIFFEFSKLFQCPATRESAIFTKVDIEILWVSAEWETQYFAAGAFQVLLRAFTLPKHSTHWKFVRIEADTIICLKNNGSSFYGGSAATFTSWVSEDES